MFRITCDNSNNNQYSYYRLPLLDSLKVGDTEIGLGVCDYEWGNDGAGECPLLYWFQAA